MNETPLDFVKYYPEISCLANDNISGAEEHVDFEQSEKMIAESFEKVLEGLMIDFKNDPNTKETPKRIAKMLMREVLRGKYEPMPELKTFPNTKNLDTLFTIGPISVRSLCSHHFVPIIGSVWIGVIPGERLLGLSKFARLTDWVMSRPQIQEEATCMLADIIQETISPKGLIVVMKAEHMCMSWRGVKEKNAIMTSSVVKGLLEQDHTKQEFFSLIGGLNDHSNQI